MKNLRNNQYGFHAIEAILVVAVLVGVGFAGWRIYSANNSSGEDATSASQVAEIQVIPIENVVAPQVQSSADLDTAQAALDQLEASDSLDGSQFDSDVEELL